MVCSACSSCPTFSAVQASSVCCTTDCSAQDTFELEIAHFLDCLRTGQEPITSGRSQRRALEIVL
jgi:hypothetical protein